MMRKAIVATAKPTYKLKLRRAVYTNISSLLLSFSKITFISSKMLLRRSQPKEKNKKVIKLKIKADPGFVCIKG